MSRTSSFPFPLTSVTMHYLVFNLSLLFFNVAQQIHNMCSNKKQGHIRTSVSVKDWCKSPHGIAGPPDQSSPKSFKTCHAPITLTLLNLDALRQKCARYPPWKICIPRKSKPTFTKFWKYVSIGQIPNHASKLFSLVRGLAGLSTVGRSTFQTKAQTTGGRGSRISDQSTIMRVKHNTVMPMECGHG